MIITWLGQSCFKIQGDSTTVITDPFDKEIGLKVPRMAADIVTVSHDEKGYNNVSAVNGVSEDVPFVISNPGEYEVKNTFVYGVTSFCDDAQGKERGSNTIYRIDIDGVKIAHCGNLGHLLTSAQLERLEGVDILLVPVGGVETLDGKQAAKVINQIEPRVVIPMHYKISGLKAKLDEVDIFTKEMGVSTSEVLDKFKISKKDLPQENLKVVLLQA